MFIGLLYITYMLAGGDGEGGDGNGDRHGVHCLLISKGYIGVRDWAHWSTLLAPLNCSRGYDGGICGTGCGEERPSSILWVFVRGSGHVHVVR